MLSYLTSILIYALLTNILSYFLDGVQVARITCTVIIGQSVLFATVHRLFSGGYPLTVLDNFFTFLMGIGYREALDLTHTEYISDLLSLFVVLATLGLTPSTITLYFHYPLGTIFFFVLFILAELVFYLAAITFSQGGDDLGIYGSIHRGLVVGLTSLLLGVLKMLSRVAYFTGDLTKPVSYLESQLPLADPVATTSNTVLVALNEASPLPPQYSVCPCINKY